MRRFLTLVITLVLLASQVVYGDVSDKPVVDIEVVRQPTRVVYGTNEDIDLAGIQVRVTFNDGTQETVCAEDLTAQGFQKGVIGSQLVIAKYGNYSAPFTVTVKEQAITKIRATLKSTNLYEGDVITADDVTVKGVLDVGGTVDINNFRMAPYTVVIGGNTVTITYGELETSITFSGRENTLQSISVDSPGKSKFLVGEDFSTDGLKVTAKYTKGNTSDVTGFCQVEPPDMSEPGRQYAKVKYKGREAVYAIELIKVTFDHIDLENYTEDGSVKLYFDGIEEPVTIPKQDVYKIDNNVTGERTLRVWYLGQMYETVVELPEEERLYTGHKTIIADVPIRMNLVTDESGMLGYYQQTALDAKNCKVKLTVTPVEESVVSGVPLTITTPEYMKLSIPRELYDGKSSITLNTKMEVLN